MSWVGRVTANEQFFKSSLTIVLKCTNTFKIYCVKNIKHRAFLFFVFPSLDYMWRFTAYYPYKRENTDEKKIHIKNLKCICITQREGVSQIFERKKKDITKIELLLLFSILLNIFFKKFLIRQVCGTLSRVGLKLFYAV